ncbi:MAG: DUF1206 domain-containing protein [Ornithinibacter sp.]
MSNSATDLGHRARHSDWLDHAVRIGLVAYGVVHLMVAWLAAQLALGDRQGSASSKGALQQLAQQPFGEVLVWLVALGMFLLVLWRVLEAALGHREEEHRTRKRLVSALKAVLYAAIGISALGVAMGSGGGSNGTDSTTRKLMDLPAGPWIVGAVGLAVIGYGVALCVQAWTEKFAKHLSWEGKTGDTGTAYLWFGKAGYVAKGVATAIVGGLFVYAAATHDPKKSGGLDQALQKVLQQPFGQVLLLVIAAGIACYGLFCFARARHLSR